MCEDSALFPAPLSESEAGWEELFEFIGRLIGKAIIDKRHIDFRLSSTFWKLIFNQPVSLIDLQSVDLNVGKHLIDLYIHPNDVEKTGLVFTLPGYDSIELKANGSRIYVNKSNLDEYIYLCSSITLNQIPQAKALRRGLDSIIPVDILALMTLNEIEDLLLGENESHWEIEVLKQFICPSHGFNENSKTFLNLLNVLSKLTQENRKKFLEFVTGFPRLPIGGFEKLQPRLTVVKKDDFLEPDSCLPSVMTCQNYLKIPDYSCEEILESKLLMAINEGRQAFHLS
jgi:E3 ubiquitin-protein ligase TRIP12